MRLARIHVDLPLDSGAEIGLPRAQSHYLATVLRLDEGSDVVLFNGDGREFPARIAHVDKKAVRVALGEAQAGAAESPLETHLGLVLSRGERMDYAVQKSTELGVSHITPLFSERCEVKLKPERATKRQRHWQQVAASACEQCGRARIPAIDAPRELSDWVAGAEAALRLVFDQRQDGPPAGASVPRSVALLVGPEGGLTETELALARAHAFHGIRLGPRVLRTETAPVAALSLLQYLWGDFTL